MLIVASSSLSKAGAETYPTTSEYSAFDFALNFANNNYAETNEGDAAYDPLGVPEGPSAWPSTRPATCSSVTSSLRQVLTDSRSPAGRPTAPPRSRSCLPA